MMKFFAFILAASLATTSTAAVECTKEQLAALNSESENAKVQAACGDALAAAQSAMRGATGGVAEKICNDKKCLSTLQQMMVDAPDCTIGGFSTKATYKQLVEDVASKCKALTGVDTIYTTKPLVPSSASSAPSASTPAPVSLASGVTPTISVVVAVTATAWLAYL